VRGLKQKEDPAFEFKRAGIAGKLDPKPENFNGNRESSTAGAPIIIQSNLKVQPSSYKRSVLSTAGASKVSQEPLTDSSQVTSIQPFMVASTP